MCAEECDLSHNLWTHKYGLFLAGETSHLCNLYKICSLKVKIYLSMPLIFLIGVMSDLETTKTEDVRQCALCQQCGDSAPSVSLTVLTALQIKSQILEYRNRMHYVCRRSTLQLFVFKFDIS